MTNMAMKKDKIKFRRTWDINPETQIKDSNKRYNRVQNKQELLKSLEDLEQSDEEELSEDWER